MFFTTTASSHCNLWLGSMIFQFYLLLSFPIVPALFRFNILFAFIILMKILCPMWLCDCICWKRISPTLTDPLVTLAKSKLFWLSQSNRFSKLHISSSVIFFFFFFLQVQRLCYSTTMHVRESWNKLLLHWECQEDNSLQQTYDMWQAKMNSEFLQERSQLGDYPLRLFVGMTIFHQYHLDHSDSS